MGSIVGSVDGLQLGAFDGKGVGLPGAYDGTGDGYGDGFAERVTDGLPSA